jgi:hypothetical protein
MGTMSERIEKFKAAHLDECAHLFMTAFNAEPWNDKDITTRRESSWPGTYRYRDAWAWCLSTKGSWRSPSVTGSQRMSGMFST